MLAADIRSIPRLIYADTLPATAGTRMLLLALPINERVWSILDLSDNGEDPAGNTIGSQLLSRSNH